MRCTLPSRSTPTTVTCSRPRTGSTPDTICARKECIPRTEHFSGVRAVPSSPTVRECAARIASSLAGIAPVPRAFATNRGGHWGPGSIIEGGVSGRQRSGEAAVNGGSGSDQWRQRPEAAAVAVDFDGGSGSGQQPWQQSTEAAVNGGGGRERRRQSP